MLPYSSEYGLSNSIYAYSLAVQSAVAGDVITFNFAASCFAGKTGAPAISLSYVVPGGATTASIAAAVTAAINALHHPNIGAAVTGVTSVFFVYLHDFISAGATPYPTGTMYTNSRVLLGPVLSVGFLHNRLIREKAMWDVMYDSAVSELSTSQSELSASLASEAVALADKETAVLDKQAVLAENLLLTQQLTDALESGTDGSPSSGSAADNGSQSFVGLVAAGALGTWIGLQLGEASANGAPQKIAATEKGKRTDQWDS